ncbi:MAG: hypothetical protein ACUVUG_04910 [Candidatus Aminicenantia bacterium]
MKDAYLQWKKGKSAVLFGISPTPTWEFIEGFWGYGSVEKTPLDLYKMGDPRDFGIAFRGSVGEKDLLSYHIMIGNGEGIKSETNKEKRFMGSLRIEPFEKSLSIEIYGDYAQGLSHTNSWAYQGFLGYKFNRGRIGLQYSYQVRQMGFGKESLSLDVLSSFFVWNITGKISSLIRYDKVFDSLPWAPSISYVPINGTSPFNTILVGLDFHLLKNVSFIPNIMIINYERTEGKKPSSDIYLKLTLFYSF